MKNKKDNKEMTAREFNIKWSILMALFGQSSGPVNVEYNKENKPLPKRMTADKKQLTLGEVLSGKMGKKGKILTYFLIIVFVCGLLASGLYFWSGIFSLKDDIKYLKIEGEYQIVESKSDDNNAGSWWRLSIHETNYDDEKHVEYFSIYDNEAGNPGVEGKIVELTDNYIKVLIDPEYYDQLPSGKWHQKGKYLEISYTKNNKDIILSNNNISLYFEKEQ